MQFKRIKRAVHGVLLLDKPYGFSSNQALQKVKWLYQAEKAGHTGTLDPLATGVLPICFGEATKFAQYLTDENKTYIADIRFGISTTTGDIEGEVIQQVDCHVSLADIEQVLPQFMGEISQVPPMYSALKVNGKPLYAYARDGVELMRAARQVTIHALRVLECADNHAKIEVCCSKGTYIRTLAEDIGNALQAGAHLTALRRTATATYQIAKAISIDALASMTDAQRDALLLPVDTAIAALPKILLPEDAAYYFKQGNPVWMSGAIPHSELRIYSEAGLFLGVGLQQRDGRIAPKRVVNL
ncbi:tRNA pseudouridine(55) synthase TruB [Methylophilus medardicus]|uniref:tRNA pseudouridine synthase B n=1 Tax=Methylophilus medardicus TaxID=2588534 RepID=A0A5B8CV38_9PROT|nr:tRNA pseudouridine(55) synthase TruB [Methylophilus medardicus]QDC45133.1 tRNA pseudouridine(55) synthase TruB [Methylophilus medardicus]QDC50140.1 tRNA pseudouridine(55) synthase TruB [Methylophilus medardicus]QDC53845.1 tRNA pseudouridine(55) synthase TruB [Methylophilus medardicus]